MERSLSERIGLQVQSEEEEEARREYQKEVRNRSENDSWWGKDETEQKTKAQLWRKEMKRKEQYLKVLKRDQKVEHKGQKKRK